MLVKRAFLTAATVLASVLAAVPASAANTTYYLDCSASSNGSGTLASPWNNLTTVNGVTFGAGDQILFKRGQPASAGSAHLAPEPRATPSALRRMGPARHDRSLRARAPSTRPCTSTTCNIGRCATSK